MCGKDKLRAAMWRQVLLLALAVSLAACGGRSTVESENESPAVRTATPAPAATVAASLPEETAAPTVTATTAPTATGTNAPAATAEASPSETAAAPSAEATALPPATETPTPAPSTTAVAAPPVARPEGAIVVDHTSVDLFAAIPDEYLQAAAALRMVYVDRSVGSNINDALDCLSFPSESAAPNHCRRFQHPDPAYSVAPEVVSWSRPGGHDRRNWVFMTWEDANCASWSEKVNCFFDMMNPVMDQFDVLSFQLSYLAVSEGADIIDEPGGFFWDNTDRYDVYDQAVYEAQHSDKVFIYWTTSLARGIGSSVSDRFNDQMRQYALANAKPLFDVADILSHDPDGNPCYDNRDGVSYDNGNNAEDYPDDGHNYLAICPHYTTETDGGHLGSTSAGKIRVAKAFWVLMSQIAGWDGR